MTELDLNVDFRDLLLALADAEADFLLVGGWALAVHGHVRGTDDLDILVRATPTNAEELFASEGYGYRMGIKPNLIEVLTTIDGLSFDEAWSDHQVVTIDGRTIPVIGRKALLRNKKASGRPKDLADAAWLEEHEDAG